MLKDKLLLRVEAFSWYVPILLQSNKKVRFTNFPKKSTPSVTLLPDQSKVSPAAGHR